MPLYRFLSSSPTLVTAHAPADSSEYVQIDEAASGVAGTYSRGCQGAMAHPLPWGTEQYYYLSPYIPSSPKNQ